MNRYKKSNKLANVCYDIRGPVLEEAVRLEEEGYKILRLNIGNPAPFGFEAPEEIVHDIICNLPNAQGYCESQGLFQARKAVMQDCQLKGFPEVEVDDIYMGNGVSELISLSMQALLDSGDEILIPAPDYPLWTAAATLAGGTVRHYHCDEQSDWSPDIDDIKSKINENTRGLVIINPNNPTGAVYPREVLESMVQIAEEHKLILFADEIYDRIVYDGAEHIPVSTLTETVPVFSYNGLSKVYRAAGFRAGWMILSGNKKAASDYIEGIKMLSNMRLCSNVPVQYGVQTALGGYQSINDLVKPGGRLYRQREYMYERLTAIQGISCVKPKGALYMFPKFDHKRYPVENDLTLVLDILRETRIMMVQGTGFNWKASDHFRLVFLPGVDLLEEAFDRLDNYFELLEKRLGG